MPILPPLPRPQRRRIHKIIHATRDKGHARRLMAILLLHEGCTITDVHHITGAAHSTIGRWLRWYRDEGVGALEALPAGRARSYLSPRLSPYWCCSCSFLRKILVINAAVDVLSYWLSKSIG